MYVLNVYFSKDDKQGFGVSFFISLYSFAIKKSNQKTMTV